MTVAEFSRKGNHFRAIISGHANYNPGNDIVCASCSMLACALAENIMRLRETGEIEHARTRRTDGEMVIAAEGKSKKLWHIVQAYGVGFEMLAETYPDNVMYIDRVGARKAPTKN